MVQMKNLLKIIITLSVLLIVGCNNKEEKLPDQKYDRIITKYTEIKQIVSSEVDDTFFVYIRLPKHYKENPDKKYTTLYLLDGDISFNMATSVVRYLQFGEDVPDLILVAPAYGTMLSDKEKNYRERDYTISKMEKFKGSGKGEHYLGFIKNELIPLIDSSYRTNENRILNGYSIGGLFALNIFLTSPELFNSYIAGSPYLANDINELLEKSSGLKLQQSKKLFVSVGELEEKELYHIPIKKIVSNLKGVEGIDLKFTVFDNGTHFTCPSEALTYGLKFVFSD
jgi:hypothetical protein